jgi:hypothetical protein
VSAGDASVLRGTRMTRHRLPHAAIRRSRTSFCG